MDSDISKLTSQQIKQRTEYLKEQIAKANAIKEYEKVKKEYERIQASKKHDDMFRSDYE
jgi:hypothetical protein